MQIKGIKVEWTQTFEHHCTLVGFLYNFILRLYPIQFYNFFAFCYRRGNDAYRVLRTSVQRI